MSIVKPIIGLDLDEVAEGSDAVDEIVLGAVCVQSRSVLQRAKRNALHRGRLSQLFVLGSVGRDERGSRSALQI